MDAYDDKKQDIDDDIDLKESKQNAQSLLSEFVTSTSNKVQNHDASKLADFNKKLNTLLSVLSFKETHSILNDFYSFNSRNNTDIFINNRRITPFAACLNAFHSFSNETHKYIDNRDIFNEYWNILLLFLNFGSNPAKYDNNDNDYSFETICEYLLPSLYNPDIGMDETEIMNRYLYVMSFGTQLNNKYYYDYHPSIFSIEYNQYNDPSMIDINMNICGNAFYSFLSDSLSQIKSPLILYQLLQNGYILMDNNSNDKQLSTMFDILFSNNNTKWISYRYNSLFLLYLWIMKAIYNEFRNGFSWLLNQCHIKFKNDIKSPLYNMQFDIFTNIMDYTIGNYGKYLNNIDQTLFCKYSMECFPLLPKKFQHWAINFIFKKLSRNQLLIIRESTKEYDEWPKQFSSKYGINQYDTNILKYLLYLYCGEYSANDYRMLLKMQCNNSEILNILMLIKLKRLMINKRILIEIWMNNKMNNNNLRIFLNKIYNETVNDINNELCLSRALTGAFSELCCNKYFNVSHNIWNKIEIILSVNYMKCNKWIDFSSILDKIFNNNQICQFLINKKLLLIDDCFKNIYKLKRALLQKNDKEWIFLKFILDYFLKNGYPKYYNKIKDICIENEKVSSVRNKPKCSECFNKCYVSLQQMFQSDNSKK